ncbi:Glycerate kinase [Streptococcus mitis]|uniref:Glycerate kinase n=1 Tax=Streptococcus mitis TaxID=28037 RepID=A0A150NML0_STRMT|nr:Glycerate kinase [Streptococcus mitis]QBX08840.1 glycerate kinase [Streptococcus satellite phage Javan298]
MTLDLDNMTQAEFDKQMAEIKERNPNLFQFIADFVDRKSKHRRGGRLVEDGAN